MDVFPGAYPLLLVLSKGGYDNDYYAEEVILEGRVETSKGAYETVPWAAARRAWVIARRKAPKGSQGLLCFSRDDTAGSFLEQRADASSCHRKRIWRS